MRGTNPLEVPVRFSRLNHVGRSAAHYKHAIDHERPDSPAMRLGRAAHLRTLGAWPDGEDGETIVYPGTRRGKAWEAFRDEHPDADIVTAGEWDTAGVIASAVLLDELASSVMRGGVLEQRIDWEIAGRVCTSRPDCVGPAGLVDLKTCRDASVAGFQRQAWRMGYHAQLDFYAEAVRHATGRRPENVYLVAVEVTPPHVVTVHRLSDETLRIGGAMWRTWWEALRAAELANHWPGYSERIEPFEPPAWAGGFELSGLDEAGRDAPPED